MFNSEGTSFAAKRMILCSLNCSTCTQMWIQIHSFCLGRGKLSSQQKASRKFKNSGEENGKQRKPSLLYELTALTDTCLLGHLGKNVGDRKCR